MLTDEQHAFLERLKAGLAPADVAIAPLIVAVSGGADSVALLSSGRLSCPSGAQQKAGEDYAWSESGKSCRAAQSLPGARTRPK